MSDIVEQEPNNTIGEPNNALSNEVGKTGKG